MTQILLIQRSRNPFRFISIDKTVPNRHTIRKVKFLPKNSILTKLQHFFMGFSAKNFLTIFLVKSKLSTAKKSKTAAFSRVFHPKKIDNFLGKVKLNFWTKNEDFEQCAVQNRWEITLQAIWRFMVVFDNFLAIFVTFLVPLFLFINKSDVNFVNFDEL